MCLGLADHGVQCHLFFQVVVTHKGQAVGVCWPGSLFGADLTGYRWCRKEPGNSILEVAFDAFALDTDFPHRLEVTVLFIVTSGIVCQLEQGVVDSRSEEHTSEL